MRLMQSFRMALYLLFGANYVGEPKKSEAENSWQEMDEKRTYFEDIYRKKLTWMSLFGYIMGAVLVCWIFNPAEWVVVCLLAGFAFLWARLISAKVIFASYSRMQKRNKQTEI